MAETSPHAQVLLYYCDADASEHDLLIAGLDTLRDEGVIITWCDHNISMIESDSQSEQDPAQLFTIDVVLLSPAFVSSGGCAKEELQSALHGAKNAALITIVIHPVEADDPTVSKLLDRALEPVPLSAIDNPGSVADALTSAIRDACRNQFGPLAPPPDEDDDRLTQTRAPQTQAPHTKAPHATAYGRSSVEPKDPMPERIGEKFMVRRILGEGAFGRVYLAEDEKLQRLVAIKVAHQRCISDVGDIEAYEREAQLVAQLDHPNIVPVLEVGTDENQFYVVSKYIEGRNVAQLLRESRPPFHVTAEIVATVAEALHCAHQHERHIVHRDVKPANILMDKKGRAYIADFGLAIEEDERGDHLKLAGTPAYMSPEQARCEGHRIDGRTDVFSLGVVMYELLTGEHPFLKRSKREDKHKVLDRIKKAEVRPPRQSDDSIPMPLEKCCLRAMANRLSDRYTNAKDLADDIWYYLEGGYSASSHDGYRSSGGSGDSRGRRSRFTDSRTEGSARMSGSTRASGAAGISGRSRSHGSHDIASRRDSTAHPSSRSGSQLDGEHREEGYPVEQVQIIPKGLRAFDQDDANFFLELLPGPTDRYAIPVSIGTWRRKIETFDAIETFRVGVIYGPSGCGKSSFVRAGLLPLLDERVHPIIIAATSKGTEVQFAAHLARLEPPEDADLPEIIGWIRRGRGIAPQHKMLIVIDQFEQWLQSSKDSDALVNSLRQCDGARVQCLLIVRDDFIMGIRRFMNDLDVTLQEGTNTAGVDLFDPLHARNVLRSFGVGYRRLPEKDEELSAANRDFLDGAIEELKDDGGRIVPVHLALLTEMCKGREWKRETLETFGGTRGIGEAFLQDKFERSHFRVFEQPARAVLKSLLPLPGSRIRAQTRSRCDLARTSGFAVEAKEFAELLEILDQGTRLITPVESSATGSTGSKPDEVAASPATEKSYQLTHDYLVPSLRQWLTRKQKETARGRAEIRLEELSLLWNDKPEARRLPGFAEWLNICARTPRSDWSPAERRMMKVSTWWALGKAAFVATLLILSVFVFRSQQQQRIERQVIAEVEKLPTAITSEVPGIVSRLFTNPNVSKACLRDRYPEHSQKSLGKLNTSIALLALAPEDDGAAELLDYVYERMQDASPSEVRGIQESLARNQELLTRVRAEFALSVSNALPLASILAANDPDHEWPAGMNVLVAQQLVDEPTDRAGSWTENLRPVQGRLRAPLLDIFASLDPTQLQARTAAGDLLIGFAPVTPEEATPFLVNLVPHSTNVNQFKRIAGFLAADPAVAIQALEEKLAKLDATTIGTYGELREAMGRQQMYVVAAILKLGGSDVAWSKFEHTEDPTTRSLLIEHLSSLGVDVSVISERLKIEKQDVSIRRALCLALAGYSKNVLNDDQIAELVNKFDLYKLDPDAGLHAAADYAYRMWIAQEIISPTEPVANAHSARDETTPVTQLDQVSPCRYQSASGREMVAIRGPVTFEMGSPASDADREGGPDGSYEARHKMEIPRSFAIAATEVTVLEFVQAWQKFLPDHPEFHEFVEVDSEEGKLSVLANKLSPSTAELRYSPYESCPINGVNWFQAAAYCNWLSKEEGIPPEQWCYPVDQKLEDQMTLPDDYLQRTGYRLPTEAEWEYVCRAGSTTSRFYGEGTSLLPRYAWFLPNSNRVSHPVGGLKPNDFGLFDVLGNVEEWCQDEVRSYLTARPVDNESEDLKVDKQVNRIHRGGSFEYVTQRVRAANRDRSDPDYGYPQLGFRVARTLP